MYARVVLVGRLSQGLMDSGIPTATACTHHPEHALGLRATSPGHADAGGGSGTAADDGDADNAGGELGAAAPAVPPAKKRRGDAVAAVARKVIDLKCVEALSEVEQSQCAMSCGGCNRIFEMYDEVKLTVSRVVNLKCPERHEYAKSMAATFEENTLVYLRHILRCRVQQRYIDRMIMEIAMRTGHALVTLDFKMKILPLRHRGTQQDYFGDRGLCFHGCCLYVNFGEYTIKLDLSDLEVKAETAYQDAQTYYMFDLPKDISAQDAAAVVCILEAVVARIKQLFPRMESLSFRTDNASCYASSLVMLFAPYICKQYGLRAVELVHNESGDGKTTLDGAFGVVSNNIKVRRCCVLLDPC